MDTQASSPTSPSKTSADRPASSWQVLLFVLIYAGLLFAIGHVTKWLQHPIFVAGDMTPNGLSYLEACIAGVTLLATFAMSRWDRRSWLDYGLRSNRYFVQLLQGLGWGVLVMAVLMGALVVTHGVTLSISDQSVSSLAIAACQWALAFLLVGFAEEATFRGYVLFKLRRSTTLTVALIASSVLFGLAHVGNEGESVLGILQVVGFGLVCCLAIWRTGSLWWGIGFHAAWDWSETFLFGTADSGRTAAGHWLTTHPIGPTWLSGGTVGPEGSVLVFPAMALGAAIIWWTLPRTVQTTSSGALATP